MAVMTAEEAAEAGKNLSFEKVWAALMETRENIERMSREADKRFEEMREQSRKTDEQIKKTSQEVDRLSKNVGGLNRSMGELIETLIAARLWEKFQDYPYNLQRAYQRIPIYDENKRVRSDIDILLADTEWVMAVEVKQELEEKHVEYHRGRMELIRKYPPVEAKGKKLLGALAAGVVDADVKDYAYRAGFFVLELTGESVGLIQPPAGFKPQEW